MGARFVAPLAALAVAAALPVSARACPGISDGILCVPLPHGWTGSVNRGVTGRRSAAYLVAGNFHFRSGAHPEGLPSVPRGRVAVSIGDFPLVGEAAAWPQVRRLRLPTRLGRGRTVSLHVRFSGRAVSVWVRFGSTPTAQLRRLVNARLAAVRRLRR